MIPRQIWTPIRSDFQDDRRVRKLIKLTGRKEACWDYLCLVNNCAACGDCFCLTDDVDSAKEFARILDSDISPDNAQKLLSALLESELIINENGMYVLPQIKEYREQDRAEKIRESNRIRQAKKRERDNWKRKQLSRAVELAEKLTRVDENDEF